MINDIPPPPEPATSKPPVAEDGKTVPASSLYRVCEELIGLREINSRQHKLFEQALARARDEMTGGLNAFTADTQRAYQQLRQELHGDKRVSLALLNELLEIGQDLDRIVASRPEPTDPDALARWAESVAVESRKVQASLARHGVVPYDAAVGQPYDPALHERVGGRAVEGFPHSRVVEQRERGYASLQPDFVLSRPKVIVSE
jgi:molecular chaperone GrpE (heat shock protein)